MTDVSQKISPEDKTRIKNLHLECMVLQNLLKERAEAKKEVLSLILVKLGAQPTLYGIKVNFDKDEWLLELKPDVLVLPNRAERRATAKN